MLVLKASPDSPNFWIATTMGCNFDCPYCFEKHENIVMTAEIQEATIAYIASQISESTKVLSIVWYGGEPTLTPAIIQSMSKKLVALAKEHKLEYRASIITNGYLLSDTLLDLLAECKVSSIQITLDGPKETHDQRRYLKGRQPTFDVIMKNLKAASKRGFKIQLRVNLDKKNAEDFSKIQAEVKDLPGVICYSAIVNDAFTQEEEEKEKHFTSTDSYEEHMHLDAEKYSLQDVLQTKTTCGALLGHGFIVHPEGSLFCCSSDISQPQKAVGSVLAPQQKVQPPYDTSYIENEEICGKCAYLPVCWGGCPKDYTSSGMLKCSYVKRILPLVMERVLEEKISEAATLD